MSIIFENFPSVTAADAFVTAVKQTYGLAGYVFADNEPFDRFAKREEILEAFKNEPLFSERWWAADFCFHPFQTRPPYALIDRAAIISRRRSSLSFGCAASS